MGCCCWRALTGPCKSDHAIPCLKPSAPAPTARGRLFSVTTLLLTSMPSPRCPSYPECPLLLLTRLTHPSRLGSGDRSRKPCLHLPGWVRRSLCVSSPWNSPHVLCLLLTRVCPSPTGSGSSRGGPAPSVFYFLAQCRPQRLSSEVFFE